MASTALGGATRAGAPAGPAPAPFIQRHVGTSDAERSRMLAALGLGDIDELMRAVVPRAIRDDEPPELPAALGEPQALAALRRIAERNLVRRSLIGQGYHNTDTPGVVRRNVLENPAWYTAYTPYQAEISQGRLEAMFHFQTMICELTGLGVANASLLDEATAAAEAMAMCRRVSGHASPVFFVDRDALPQTIAVLRTRAAALGISLRLGPAERAAEREAFGALLQYPGASGRVPPLDETVAALHRAGALAVVAADLLGLALLRSPGQLGADVAVGTTQRFGVPMACGGPHAGYMSATERFTRALPGRIIGLSEDSAGRPAYRMALQTREQHIRRERATSNICTAQTLPAVLAVFYAMYHGPQGLRRIAERVHRLAVVLARGLAELGFGPLSAPCFDTVTVDAGERSAQIHERARRAGVNLRRVDGGGLGASMDETVSPDEVEGLWRIFGADARALRFDAVDARAADALPGEWRRADDFLTQEAFGRYHSETEMTRCIRRLADRDIALDRAMIPLGSCTMKLNAAAEMAPISWPEFADIHPLAPADQLRGYRQLVDELGRQLCALTGYAAISFQPNAGSQGEYAGLLAIRAYHASRGEPERNVCLIPESAHGTNPASARAAGLRVEPVSCERNGNVDIGELRAKAGAHAGRLAAAMLTYPSTHGVYEAHVRELCDAVHQAGGLVYIDGANLNAAVGLCRPGGFGGDVSHLNLHKTFCIPHGGGGPGVGPVAVGERLAGFLPASVPALGPEAGAQSHPVGPVSAATWGSAGILPISWMYLRMTGAEGQRRATQAAILHANYVAHRLRPHYPTLYAGERGFVAHECIVDLRDIKRRTGVSAEDVAKRLIDFGFHAPTVSFPVAETLMIEPTESESMREIERFCAAMAEIRREIAEIERGEMDVEASPLRHAPHTAADVIRGDWTRAYSKEQAVYPPGVSPAEKYWPPVSRVDNARGDRRLRCRSPRP